MRPISDYTIFDIGAERNNDQKKAYRNMWIAASAGFAAILLFGFVGLFKLFFVHIHLLIKLITSYVNPFK